MAFFGNQVATRYVEWEVQTGKINYDLQAETISPVPVL